MGIELLKTIHKVQYKCMWDYRIYNKRSPHEMVEYMAVIEQRMRWRVYGILLCAVILCQCKWPPQPLLEHLNVISGA